MLDNGKIELLLVRNITRRYLMRVFPAFKAGRLETISGVDKYIIPMRAEEVILKPESGTDESTWRTEKYGKPEK